MASPAKNFGGIIQALWEALHRGKVILLAGDTLVVWKLDRLGRTVLQSVQFLTSLHKERIEFRSLDRGDR